MKLDILPVGMYEENCYVLHDKGHVLIVDPGRRPEKIAACIGADETVDGILLTHGHSDHTMAADDLAEKYGCPVFMDRRDIILTSPSGGRVDGTEYPVYAEISDLTEGEMKLGGFDLEIIHTPGHTAGSTVIRCRNILFTGDTLFAGTIGRTDLFSGSESEMIGSLQRLKALPHDLKICPGHGPVSTIGRELTVNPYLR